MIGVPKALWIALGSGLVLLAVAGATGAVKDGLQDNYHADCLEVMYGGPHLAPREDRGNGNTPDGNTTDGNNTNGDASTEPQPTTTPEDRQACRDARTAVTVADVLFRASLGPGIALVAVGAVFLIGVAIGGRRP